MKWSSGMIADLVSVVEYFKRGGMGKTLEVLADHFIEKMKKRAVIETYAMEFHSENIDVDAERIGPGEYKLAFICHIVNLRNSKKDRKEKKIKGVYDCLSVMIKYCVMKILKYKEKRDYRIYFLSYIIKENLLPEHKIDEKDDKILEVITLSYYLTDELIKITNSDETHKFQEFRNLEYEDNERNEKNEKDEKKENEKMEEINMNSIYENRSLISHCENLDISICTRKQIRELYSILGTKRTIFVRILLVLAFEIIHRKSSVNKSWLNKFVKFKNKKEFLSLMSSPLVEVFLFITSERIKFRNVTESF